MVDNARYGHTIKEMPDNERPRERLLNQGTQALSNGELLAIILRTGTRYENVVELARRLLNDFGGLAGLGRASIEELVAVQGLGPAKVTQIKAALELGRRMMATSPGERAQIRSPADAANVVMTDMGLLEQEELRVMLLDTKNRVLSTENVYKGSLNTSLIRVGELFRYALRNSNCNSLIVIHNHPSGDPTPSPEDVAVTKQIVDAGRLLDVEVLDHLIIGWQSFVSLKEQGLGFN